MAARGFRRRLTYGGKDRDETRLALGQAVETQRVSGRNSDCPHILLVFVAVSYFSVCNHLLYALFLGHGADEQHIARIGDYVVFQA